MRKLQQIQRDLATQNQEFVKVEVDLKECHNVTEAMDSGAMGVTMTWYHRGETSMESSIPYSH